MRTLPLLLALLICAIGLLLAWPVMFGQPAATVAAKPPGEIRNGLPQGHVYAGVTSEPDDVNPFTSHSKLVRRFVLGLTHEGLLDADPVTGALRGAVAEAWQLAADGMSCTFTLRTGICFSDGQPVTMADVLFGWELARAGHLPLGFVNDAFARVAAAEAVDDRRLRVTFMDRHYAAVQAVGESWLVPQREFFLARVAAASERLGEPAPAVTAPRFATLLGQIDRECGPGTGPFQLPSDEDGPTTWRRRQDLTLTINPHHWRREAEPGSWNLHGMRLLFLQGAAIANAVHRRQVDWAGFGSVDDALRDFPDLAADYRKLSYDYRTLGVIDVVWNCEQPPFDDVRVRRALSMLFDRDSIVAGHPDRAVPAFAFAKPGSAGYPEVEPVPFDPGRARQLLREAGFDPAAGKPLRVRVLAPTDRGIMDLAMSLLASAAKEAGVVLEPTSVAWEPYVAQKVAREWDGLMIHRSFRPWGDPMPYLHSAGMDNEGRWQNAEVDRLLTAAQRELDAGKRAALWQKAHALVYAEQPVTFLVHPRSCVLFNKHIEAAVPGPRGLWPERWWVPEKWQRQ